MKTLRAVAGFAFVVALFYGCYKLLPVYLAAYQFDDAIQEEAKLAAYSPRTEADIQATILKKALEENAVSLVLCHNHPSGSLKPSRQDEEITKKIKEAAKYFDIKVLDHIIVSDSGYFSFADEGIL